MKMKKKSLYIILPLIVLAAGAFFYFQYQSARNRNASLYQTLTVEKGVLTGTVGATGTVHAKQSAYLTWLTNGIVGRVNYQFGDKVRAGDILASMNTASLPQNVILAEVDLVSAQKALEDLQRSRVAATNAEVTLITAQADFEDRLHERKILNYEIKYKEFVRDTKWGPLYKKKKRFATEKEINDANARLAAATAKVEDAQREWDRLKNGPDPRDIAAAEARVSAAKATLDLQNIVAPFSGTITDELSLPGDVVSAGTRAFRLDDLSSMLVDVEVSEVDINSVKLGQEVRLSFDAILSKEYHGKVTKVARVGTSSQGVVNFTVTVEMSDADELVLSQMTAAVNIVVVQLSDVVLIPNQAVRLMDGDRVVYLLQNGIPTAVKIEVGASSDNFSALISGDLKPGDTIVLNPPTSLFTNPNQGMQMRPGN